MKLKYSQLCKYGVASFLATLLIACSSSSDPVPTPITQVYNQQAIKFDWKNNSLNPSAAGSFIPILDGNTLFTADKKGLIYRLDKTDGSVISKFNLKRKLSSGTATSSDSIFVTTEDGYLLSVNKVTGDINWQAQLPTLSIEAPQIGANLVIIRTNDAEVLAFDSSNGNLVWAYFKQVPPLTLRTYNTFLVIGNEVVLIGQPGGRVVLVNLLNGSTIWETYVAVPEGATDLDKLTDVSARPSLDGKEVCIVTFNGKIGCLDALSSNIIWSRPFSTSYGILIDSNNVYAMSQEGVLFAFDKNYGNIVWSNDILKYRKLSDLSFFNGNILSVDGEGYINTFDSATGKLLTRREAGLENGIAIPITDGTRLFLQSGGGSIMALSVPDNVESMN